MLAHNMQLVSRCGIVLPVSSYPAIGAVSEPHNIPAQCEEQAQEVEQRHPCHLDSSVDTFAHDAKREKKQKNGRGRISIHNAKRSTEHGNTHIHVAPVTDERRLKKTKPMMRTPGRLPKRYGSTLAINPISMQYIYRYQLL